MLKLIYTETDLHLELLDSDIEDWVEQRLIFATSIGQTLYVTSEKAAFLLPDLVCEATAIGFYLDQQQENTVTVNRCDLDRVEIGLSGYWLATDVDSSEGIFVSQLTERVELYLWQLWCSANSRSVASDGVVW
ncbi:alr0857 family protein [Chamaesiphon minutus]|uniref:Uncharacterized protein n=1 Tax=Chamaesiphon minutus (strain ATCC 27169 / PCC 6605) TaxID=1173020 RepID=K9UHH8_CHAP6|nr:alr0857 family protein [Chamaesiphon minutus]AFY93891.1 hypothetical protein Cha6605_2855 [Chamaesiphon minutus PCC 6605]